MDQNSRPNTATRGAAYPTVRAHNVLKQLVHRRYYFFFTTCCSLILLVFVKRNYIKNNHLLF